MKPNLDIYEYLETLEKDNKSDTEYFKQLYEDSKQAREDSEFDTRCEIGYRIMTGDLSYGVKGDRDKERQFINFVDRGLKHKGSELKSARIEIALENLDGEIARSQELLESETNYVFSYLNVPRIVDACIDDMYYMNMGVVRVEWDTEADGGKNWETGLPRIRYRDPRRIYINPYIEGGDFDQNDFIFDVMDYDIDYVKKQYPEYADEIVAVLEDYKDSDGIEYRKLKNNDVSIVIHQYKKPYTIETRVLANEDTGDSRRWLEEDYQDYLRARVEEMVTSGEEDALITQAGIDLEDVGEEEFTLDMLVDYADRLAQQGDENIIFEEKIRASEKLTKEYKVWFETRFIPQLGIELQEPQISKYCSYAILPADRDPDNAYPISMAYKGAPLLELYSTLLTLQMFYAVKFNRPQAILQKGALQNEKAFLQHHNDPDFVPIVNQDWQSKHPRTEPFTYVYPEEMGRLAELLEQKLKAAIETYTRTTPAVLGMSEYSGESGKSIIAKQQSAKQGDKTDIFKLEKFYKKIADVLKWKIAVMKNEFPHETEHLDDQDERDMVEVNTGYDNQLLDSASSCYANVNIEDNVEVAAQKRKVEALELFNRGLLTAVDTLKEVNPPDVDKKIRNLKAQNDTLQIMDIIKDLPEEARSEVINNLTQMKEQMVEETDEGKTKTNVPEGANKNNIQGNSEMKPKE